MSSAPTYVLANATDNLIVGREYYRRLEHKVDGRRLTHETSEDAVSWNVFVGLFALGGLAQAYESITGQQSEREPELYLWGNRIDTAAPRFWTALKRVQRTLERQKRIPTEPDIILRVPGEAIVLIEAKFGSPNSLFEKKQKRVRPVSRYLDQYGPKSGSLDPLQREWIYAQDIGILEQLCRNVMYTHHLAEPPERQFLVNLVCDKLRPMWRSALPPISLPIR